MKQKFLLIAIAIMTFVSFTRCHTDDPDSPNTLKPTMTYAGQVSMSLDKGVIITEGDYQILTLKAIYPKLYVSSIFSLTVKAPEIAYVGQVQDIVQIPLTTDEQYSSNAVLHNNGGYIVRTSLIKQGTNDEVPCVIKLFIREGEKNQYNIPESLSIKYEVYRYVK